MTRRVVYLAAHGGFAGQAVPLGGGAAIANQLEEEWGRTKPFELRMVGPAVLGAEAPSAREIVRFNERDYAAFCQSFSAAATRAVLGEEDPGSTAVLVNDISEGPDFRRLASAGFRVYTIWHVDVVAYIANIYLKRRVRPETLSRWWETLRKYGLIRLAPGMLRLIFEQQRESLAHSRAVIVPSHGMRESILRSLTWVPADRVRVLPWGAWAVPYSEEEIETEAERLRREFDVRSEERVLLCLSRISPEKGQDLLLDVLKDWAGPRLVLFICGEPAFMMGERHMDRLRRMGGGLPGVRVVFPGYASGLRKAGFFRLADLYVFPSRHESYGLTLTEALASGLPAVCLANDGSREVMRDEFGAVVEHPGLLSAAILRLLSEGEGLRRRGDAARHFARENSFNATAERLAEWVLEG